MSRMMLDTEMPYDDFIAMINNEPYVTIGSTKFVVMAVALKPSTGSTLVVLDPIVTV